MAAAERLIVVRALREPVCPWTAAPWNLACPFFAAARLGRFPVVRWPFGPSCAAGCCF